MNRIDLEFYRGKRIFITGHTGFKGAWLCRILTNAGAIVTGYSLPPPTEPNLFSLADLGQRMRSEIGDIRDQERLREVFAQAQPEIVFHLAAQPIVRDGYKTPVYTYETNVMGTVYLLECIRTLQAPVKSVVIVTTDKVYENRNWCWGYREGDTLNGRDPYSNSKSCAELAVHSFINSFFAETNIAVSTLRAGNVIGGGDFARDRIVPDCVRAVCANRPVLIRNPHSIRPYQHVLEALFAYLMVARQQYHDKRFAGCYNVGPEYADCVTTEEVVSTFCRIWGGSAVWEKQMEADAPHEDSFLKLDCSKLKAAFGWAPKWRIQEAIYETVQWTKIWLEGGGIPAEMDRQIQKYSG